MLARPFCTLPFVLPILSSCTPTSAIVLGRSVATTTSTPSILRDGMAPANPRIIALFDVDGTLTPARKIIEPATIACLKKLREKITIGVVGGSDFRKQMEQLGLTVLTDFDYSFSENGLVAYHEGIQIGHTSMNAHLGEENIKAIVNWTLRYLSDLDIPIKRGTFIEYRTGMLNISPIGRNCSQEERDAFEVMDLQKGIRKTLLEKMREKFAHLDLTYSIGGQISFDVFPKGWDKTYCLRYLPESSFDEIHFFGDKTFEGGNDFEIFTHPRVMGHSVKNPEETVKQLEELFLK